MEQHVAVYGSSKLLRALCPSCRRYAFVLDGRLACCGRLVTAEETPRILEIKRMSAARGTRRKPPLAVQRIVLERQDGKCIYCGNVFGSSFYDERRHRFRVLAVHWDHFTPYAFTHDSNPENLVAACAVCNGIKGDKHFVDAIAAKEYISERKKAKRLPG